MADTVATSERNVSVLLFSLYLSTIYLFFFLYFWFGRFIWWILKVSVEPVLMASYSGWPLPQMAGFETTARQGLINSRPHQSPSGLKALTNNRVKARETVTFSRIHYSDCVRVFPYSPKSKHSVCRINGK